MAPACFEILPCNTSSQSHFSANLLLLCNLHRVSLPQTSGHGASWDGGSKYEECVGLIQAFCKGKKSCLFYKDFGVHSSKEMHCRRGGICKASGQQTIFTACSEHSAVCASGNSLDSISGAYL